MKQIYIKEREKNDDEVFSLILKVHIKYNH